MHQPRRDRSIRRLQPDLPLTPHHALAETFVVVDVPSPGVYSNYEQGAEYAKQESRAAAPLPEKGPKQGVRR